MFKNYLEERKYQLSYMEARAYLEQELKAKKEQLKKYLDNDWNTDPIYKEKMYLEKLISRLEKIESENDLELPSINEEELDVE